MEISAGRVAGLAVPTRYATNSSAASRLVTERPAVMTDAEEAAEPVMPLTSALMEIA